MQLFPTSDTTDRFYHASMGNEYLDDTKAAALTAFIETRQNRNF